MQQPIIKKFFRINEHFRPEDSGLYDLFLELEAGVTSFAIIRHDNQELTGLGSFENPVIPVTDEFPWLKNRFRSLKISVLNNRYTLVPFALFSSEEKDAYTDFVLDPVKEKEEVFADHVDQLDLYNVYAVPAGFFEKLKMLFPGAEIFQGASVLIRNFWVNYRNSQDGIFLNIRHEAFDLLIFDDNSLEYCNSFQFQVPEDLVYYLIFVMEQLEIDPGKASIILTGKSDQGDAIYSLVSRYINEVKYVSSPGGVKFSTLFDDLSAHRFYSLLNLGICGS